MGLFSSIFGGGGSKSTSTSRTSVTVKVNPRIVNQVDLSPVQKAIEEISGVTSEQFKTASEQFDALQESQTQATAFNALALDSFLATLKQQQTIAFLALGGVALWVITR